MAVSAKKVTQLLRTAIDQAGEHCDPADFKAWKEEARTALRIAFGEGDAVIARFDGIHYTPSLWSPSTPDSVWTVARRGGVREGVAILSAALTEVQIREPDEVAVDVAQLHPWVAGMAASLWESGNHRVAVQEAARAVEVQLRAKLGLDGGTGAPLVTDGFSAKPATPTSPRLRFLEHAEGSDPWKNAHEGAMSFGRGCFMRIRNLLQHGEEPDEQEALESLAALSLLARWIDQATVVRL